LQIIGAAKGTHVANFFFFQVKEHLYIKGIDLKKNYLKALEETICQVYAVLKKQLFLF
jgi:hypothetical protein